MKDAWETKLQELMNRDEEPTLAIMMKAVARVGGGRRGSGVGFVIVWGHHFC